mmetsp:Transcript_9188/g.38914  ORF Transcript_9188/g.38914 Transcript_9188/m.38914 type:complete len:360 (+) Transcript_9188:3803-4882(+)
MYAPATFSFSRDPSSVSSVSSREASSLGFRNGLRHSAHHATRLARRMFSSVPSSSSTRGSTPPQRGIEPGTVSSYAASPATGCPANAQCARIWWNRPASVSDATASVSTSSVDSDLFFSKPLKDARSSSRLGTYATGTTRVSAGLKPQSSVFVVPSSSSTKARLGSCPLHDFSVVTSTSARPSSPTLKGRFTTNPSFSTRPRRSARYVLRFSAPGRTSAALALALALLPFAKSHTPLTGWSTRFTAKSGSGSSRARFRIATQQFSPDKPGPMPANVGTPAGLSTATSVSFSNSTHGIVERTGGSWTCRVINSLVSFCMRSSSDCGVRHQRSGMGPPVGRRLRTSAQVRTRPSASSACQN